MIGKFHPKESHEDFINEDQDEESDDAADDDLVSHLHESDFIQDHSDSRETV